MNDRTMALKRMFNSAAEVLTGRRQVAPRPLGNPLPVSDKVGAAKSGFSQLDRAIGVGGLPQGYLTEMIGPDTGGSVTIAAKIAAKFQRKQMTVTILDATGQFDITLATRCGLVAPELLIQVPHDGLALVHLMERAARQSGLIIVYLGFIPHLFAAVPEDLLQFFLKRLCWIASHSQAVFLYMATLEAADPFIHTNYLPGFPLNEVADVRLWVQDEGWIRKAAQIGGYRGNVTVIKNRLAKSGLGANIRISFVDPEMTRLSEELGF